MMAVDVDQDDDVLTITGDQGGVSDDIVEIRRSGEEEFRVRADFGNNRLQNRFFEGIEDFIVDLRRGEDSLTIRDINDDDDVDSFTIRMGAGNDTVTIRNVVMGELDLRTDGGNDALIVRNSRFEGDVFVDLGGNAAPPAAARPIPNGDTADIRDSIFEGDELTLDGGPGPADSLFGRRNTVGEDTDVEILRFEIEDFRFDREDD